jgi:hypothetical protein
MSTSKIWALILLFVLSILTVGAILIPFAFVWICRVLFFDK